MPWRVYFPMMVSITRQVVVKMRSVSTRSFLDYVHLFILTQAELYKHHEFKTSMVRSERYHSVVTILIALFLAGMWATNSVYADEYSAVEGYDSATGSAAASTDLGPEWIIDPIQVSEDSSFKGHSLFDLLFLADTAVGSTEYDIPYPFDALLEKIAGKILDGESNIKRVMIPRGRSLRRDSESPEFFNYPRIVVAVEGEPVEKEDQAGLLLKGQLFFGYNHQSEIIEVISYNPKAGRFEFQEISNYKLGGTPKVEYANRQICLSCHQNAGPIFSREPWSETEANLQIANKIRAADPSLLTKSQYAPRFGDAWAIDYASDRATYFSSSQFIWQNGCAVSDVVSEVESVSCRAAMLAQALRFRMIGAVDKNSSQFRISFLATLEKNWRHLWPDGLFISTADIPDRVPLTGQYSIFEDPMTQRGPRAYWKEPLPHLMAGVIRQLSEFIAEVDIRRINSQLLRRAESAKKQPEVYSAKCELDVSLTEPDSSISFNCRMNELAVFEIKGFTRLQNNQVLGGYINSISLAGKTAAGTFQPGQGTLSEKENHTTLEFSLYTNRTGLGVKVDKSGFSARFDDGRLLNKIRIRWKTQERVQSGKISAEATLDVLGDFDELHSSIEQLLLDSLQGKTMALSGGSFQRQVEIHALLDELGLGNIRWRKLEKRSVTASQNNKPPKMSSQQLQPLSDYCSDCHKNSRRFPPGFLQADTKTIALKLASCAGEIVNRINQWNLPAEHRQLSPMPPPYWLMTQGLSEAEWVDSQAFERLLIAGQQLLLKGSDERLGNNSVSTCM